MRSVIFYSIHLLFFSTNTNEQISGKNRSVLACCDRITALHNSIKFEDPSSFIADYFL